MKMVATMLWLPLLAPLALASDSQASVTPIQKVLTMLGSMVKKAKQDQMEEQVEWSAFKVFCTDTESQKIKEIKKAGTKKAALKADKESHDSEVKRLAKETTGHAKDIVGYKKDIRKAIKDRESGRDTFVKTRRDYTESVDAISKAMTMMKKQTADRPQAASLLEKISLIQEVAGTSEDGSLSAFLSLADQVQESAEKPGEANAYEFQSDGIITMLAELKDKFIEERNSLEKKEVIQRHAYDSVMMDLKDSIAAAKNEISKKTKSETSNKGESIESNTLYKQVKASRDDDKSYLKNLDTSCLQKSKDFTVRQHLRGEEIASIQKAIEIISGGSVKGSAEKHVRSMIQVREGVSFLQFQSPSGQQKAIAFLHAASQRLDSSILSAVAMQMTGDPFKKVKQLIKDLITKLKKQEEGEAGKKKWCDDELKTNGKTRKDKTSAVDTLNANIDQLGGRLEVLKKSLAELSGEIAEINKAVAKAGDMRDKEKDTNEETLVEAVKGQAAVAEAIKVLTDFYKKAGSNTAFAQGPFKGQQKQGSNVLSFLEVIASDFARLEGDTKKAEDTASSEHNAFMTESKKSKDAKEKEQKTAKKEQLEKKQDLSDKNDDLETSQKQLSAAVNYFDKLKPSCFQPTRAEAYAERVGRRNDEISSLKEAMEMLNGEGDRGPDALRSGTQGGNLAVDAGQ